LNIEKLSWSGDATVTVNGIEYSCNLDCDVETYSYENKHEPFYAEPMTDALVMLDTFEASDPGGHPVNDGKLRRYIRMELVNWIEENETRIILEAK